MNKKTRATLIHALTVAMEWNFSCIDAHTSPRLIDVGGGFVSSVIGDPLPGYKRDCKRWNKQIDEWHALKQYLLNGGDL